MKSYVVYRHGSNPANQPSSIREPVGVLDCPQRFTTVDLELQNWRDTHPHVTVCSNQYLYIVSLGRVPLAHYRVACELEETGVNLSKP